MNGSWEEWLRGPARCCPSIRRTYTMYAIHAFSNQLRSESDIITSSILPGFQNNGSLSLRTTFSHRVRIVSYWSTIFREALLHASSRDRSRRKSATTTKSNIKHLMTGPLGSSEFCFPRISMFPSTSSRETDSRETKFTVPLGTSH